MGEYLRSASPRTPDETQSVADELIDATEALSLRSRVVYRDVSFVTPIGAPTLDAAPFPILVQGLAGAGAVKSVQVAWVSQQVGAPLAPVFAYWRAVEGGAIQLRAVAGLSGTPILVTVRLELGYA